MPKCYRKFCYQQLHYTVLSLSHCVNGTLFSYVYEAVFHFHRVGQRAVPQVGTYSIRISLPCSEGLSHANIALGIPWISSLSATIQGAQELFMRGKTLCATREWTMLYSDLECPWHDSPCAVWCFMIWTCVSVSSACCSCLTKAGSLTVTCLMLWQSCTLGKKRRYQANEFCDLASLNLRYTLPKSH